jgi:hypothetical protein
MKKKIRKSPRRPQAKKSRTKLGEVTPARRKRDAFLKSGARFVRLWLVLLPGLTLLHRLAVAVGFGPESAVGHQITIVEKWVLSAVAVLHLMLVTARLVSTLLAAKHESRTSTEIEPPLLAELLAFALLRSRNQDDLAGDLRERYKGWVKKYGKSRASWRYLIELAITSRPLARRLLAKLDFWSWVSKVTGFRL